MRKVLDRTMRLMHPALMPDPKPDKLTEKAITKLRAEIGKLEDASVAAQKAKADKLQAGIDAACEKIAARYRSRIAVLSKQLGALTGK